MLNGSLKQQDSIRIAFILSLLTVGFFETQHQLYQYGLLFFSIVLLVFPSCCKNFYFFSFIVLFLLFHITVFWFSADNLAFLLFYWCLGYCLNLALNSKIDTFISFTRILTGCVFLFATIWKLISADFLSGNFFLFDTLTDRRLGPIMTLFSPSYTYSMFRENHLAFLNRNDSLETIYFSSSENLLLYSFYLAIATVVIEGLLAILFLAPQKKRIRQFKNIVFVIFIAITYIVNPVIQFGVVLCAMGSVQAKIFHEKFIYLLGIPYVFLVGLRNFLPL